MNVIIKGVETFLPEKIIPNSYFKQDSDDINPMFRGTSERRHCSRDDTAVQLLTSASKKVFEKYKIQPWEVGLILTNTAMLDIPFTGPGAAWAFNIGADPQHIYDIHNSGCTSFVFMMELAKVLMTSMKLKYALIGNCQTSAGKIFAHPQNVDKIQSVVPGDGCGVALLEAKDSESLPAGCILEAATKAHGEFAEDMYIERSDGSKWWEASESMGIIEFNQTKIMKILSRGNRSVPERISEVCKKNGKKISDINFLITNQPNPIFLRNWREFVQLPEEKMYHTFCTYGNLFSAAMPVNLSEALEKGLIKKGDLVCIAGFSHAGDYSSAILIQY